MDIEHVPKPGPSGRGRLKRPLLRIARVPRSRLRAFAAYLDRRLERFDRLVDAAGKQRNYDTRVLLKTERAELCGIRNEFRRLFEQFL